jgi:pyruvate/2-oxoglutarate/acetoin dehydrogenase E1 component
VIAEEDEAPVGVGAEVIAIINEECFFELDAAPVVLRLVPSLRPHLKKHHSQPGERVW